MFGNGLEKEVIITVLPRVEQIAPNIFSPGGLIELDYERLSVWADKGYQGRFSKIPGVLKIETGESGNKYLIAVDPRYNLKWVMAEIEAVAKTEKPVKERKENLEPVGLLYGFSIELAADDEQDKPKPKRKKRTARKP